MIIGDRIRALREAQNLSQCEIERATGLQRCYISRVENGHTVPSVSTLEKLARALGMRVYQVLYEEHLKADASIVLQRAGGNNGWGSSGQPARYFHKVRTCESDRLLLLTLVKSMVKGRPID